MSKYLTNYFRCAEDLAELIPGAPLSEDEGYFALGKKIVCYGRSSAGRRSPDPELIDYDALADVTLSNSQATLPFEPDEIIRNFYYERYARKKLSPLDRLRRNVIREVYYLLRPIIPLAIRRYLQKWSLRDWQTLRFPQWPVDSTVDSQMRELLRLAIKSSGLNEVPFLWFWPDGAEACAIMTHDVETQRGVKLSSHIMDMDQSFGIPSSFQIVPEDSYQVDQEYLDSLCNRGFEVNVQDLNHDGRLFHNKEEFKKRAAKINRYRERFGARGFRSAVLYRNQEWFDLLDFDYDMSVPNVAHLDPQRGGCCTVMPYFIGPLVELPVTTTQDYSLFHILNDYTLDLWEQQVSSILKNNGLISFIVHPDYINGPRENKIYRDLLAMMAALRSERNVWLAYPGEVATWWKQRSQMKLTCNNGRWEADGPGSERAVVALAAIDGEQLRFTVNAEAPRTKVIL